MSELITFRKLNDRDIVNEISALLTSNHIHNVVEEDAFDSIPGVNALNPAKDYRLKIAKGHFDQANELVHQYYKKYAATIGKDYYLYEFTNDELIEIIEKPDEWNDLDFQLAQLILTTRGKTVSAEQLSNAKNQRIKELATPDKCDPTLIAAGYIFSLLGGFLGVMIGYSLMAGKKTLPNGERTYNYQESDRLHGKRIFYIGLVMFITGIIVIVTKI